MDLLKLISDNSKGLSGSVFETGLAAVIRHLQRAEVYLMRGRDQDDQDFFNDVIYRTNQAYEGILKEAYELFTSRVGTRLRTADLEQHFAKESILSARVSSAFQTYRQEWRNPSTHDHRLFFSEQDATLALSTISTFVYLLLDQMIEVRASQLQQERTERSSLKKDVPSRTGKSIAEVAASALMDHALSDALTGFSKETREIEIIGTVHGHLAAALPQIKVDHDPIIQTQTARLRPDLVLNDGQNTVVVEIKRLTGAPGEKLAQALVQLESYLAATQTHQAVLYLVPSEPQDAMMQLALTRQTSDGQAIMVYLITPPWALEHAEAVLKKLGWKRGKT
jgi:hypothetical protein